MSNGSPPTGSRIVKQGSQCHQRQLRTGMGAPGEPGSGAPPAPPGHTGHWQRQGQGQHATGFQVEATRQGALGANFVVEASTSKLLVPARLVLYAVLVVPLALWAACVLAGVVHAEPLAGGTTKRDFEHPLIWFDRHVFRVWGPMLPLAPLLVRAMALGLRLPGPRAAGAGEGRCLWPGATLPLQAFLVYCIVIVVRIGLYIGHVEFERSNTRVLLSDHLLLGATVVSCFQAELLMSLSDIYKAELLISLDPSAGVRQVAVVAGMVVSMFVMVFVYADMYCTARWYHETAESVGALLTGALVFQCPMVLWLVRQASKPPHKN